MVFLIVVARTNILPDVEFKSGGCHRLHRAPGMHYTNLFDGPIRNVVRSWILVGICLFPVDVSIRFVRMYFVGSAVMNKQNGLVIRPFKRAHLTREEDMELFKLAIYLRKIAPMESIGSLRHSRWESYIAAELAHGEVDED